MGDDRSIGPRVRFVSAVSKAIVDAKTDANRSPNWFVQDLGLHESPAVFAPLHWYRPPPIFAPHVPPNVRTTLTSPIAFDDWHSTRADELRRHLLLIVALTVVACALTPVLPVFAICAAGLLVGAAATAAQLKRQRELEQALPFRKDLVRPDTDLDQTGRAVLAHLDDVAGWIARSRPAREGHLPGWEGLLADQCWQIVKASAELTKVRRILGNGAAGLPEQVRSADATAAAIEERVADVMRFAASVHEVDQSLAERDAILRREEIDESLRTAYLAASDQTSARQLDDLARRAQAGADAAIRALRAIGSDLPPPR